MAAPGTRAMDNMHVNSRARIGLPAIGALADYSCPVSTSEYPFVMQRVVGGG
jgi:hypothetical protein